MDPQRRGGATIALVLSLWSGGLGAEELTEPANRAEAAKPKTVVRVAEIPVEGEAPREETAAPPGVPVTVVDRAEIDRSAARTAADVLQRLPGVIVDGPHNKRDRNETVSIRGFESQYTLVLVDGERVVGRDAKGTFDFSTLPADSIERIEVIKGPQAAAYGTDAIGGVVNVVLRKEAKKNQVEANAGYGAFNSLTLGASGSARLGPVGWTAFVRRETSDGWSDQHDLDRDLRQVTAKWDAKRTEKSSANTAFTWSPSSRHALTLSGGAFFGRTHKDKTVARFVEEGTVIGVEDQLNLDGTLAWRWQGAQQDTLDTSLRLYRGAKEKDERQEVVQRRAGREVGTLTRDVLDTHRHLLVGPRVSYRRLLGGLHVLTLGGDARVEVRTADNHDQQVVTDTEGRVVRRADFRRPEKIYEKGEAVASAFAQGEVAFTDALTFTPALRGTATSAWGAFATPSAALAWRPHPVVTLSYAAGLGFKMPSFESRVISPVPDLDVSGERYVAGNPDLLPEQSVGNEVSVAVAWPPAGGGGPPKRRLRLEGSLSLFRNDFSNKIGNDVEENWNNTGLPLEREVNVGGAVTQGVELAGRVRLAKDALVLGANYAFLDATSTRTGRRLDNVANHSGSLLLSGKVPWTKTQIHLAARLTGERPRVDAEGLPRAEGTVPPLVLVDLRAEQRLAKWAELFLEINNLANSRWDRDNDGDTDLPPINAFAGLRVRYEQERP